MIHKEIQVILKRNFPFQHFEIYNESENHATASFESHFKVLLVSPEFENLSAIQRHQRIYRLLSAQMKKIHALALHLYTPDEWEANEKRFLKSPACSGKYS